MNLTIDIPAITKEYLVALRVVNQKHADLLTDYFNDNDGVDATVKQSIQYCTEIHLSIRAHCEFLIDILDKESFS